MTVPLAADIHRSIEMELYGIYQPYLPIESPLRRLTPQIQFELSAGLCKKKVLKEDVQLDKFGNSPVQYDEGVGIVTLDHCIMDLPNVDIALLADLRVIFGGEDVQDEGLCIAPLHSHAPVNKSPPQDLSLDAECYAPKM